MGLLYGYRVRYGDRCLSFTPGRKERYVAPPPREPVAPAVSWSSGFVRPAIPLVASGLAAMALVACLKSAAPAAPNPVALEAAKQTVNVSLQTVNLAGKGSRLATASLAAGEARPEMVSVEPKMVRLVTFIKGVAEPTSGGVSEKPIYGMVSYYSHDSRTASGERFDAREMTAAHRTLPFGTRVRVTSVDTGRSVTVRINDRGPFIRGRTLDVSRGAAQSLGIIDRGVAKMKLDVLQ
jgi:rare lipoprotein A (peptidoglycan hydrolase)